jgi:anti-sigma B factor antagonist
MQHIVTQDGEFMVVALKGEIDLEFSSKMRKVLLDSISKCRGIAVDLSGVSMIDSSGVASLLEAFQVARKRGKKLILAAPQDPVMRVLKLARLDTVFQMADDVASAKRALA